LHRQRKLRQQSLRLRSALSGGAQAGFDRVLIAIPSGHLNASVKGRLNL
jgi:hypothetical protein